MKRIEAILQDVRFQKSLLRIEQLEQQRIFCRHGLEHLLDVARIAWILTMEEQLPLDKEIVYGAALLHDIGRDRQYEEQIPHHQASAGLAAEILPGAVSSAQPPGREHASIAPASITEKSRFILPPSLPH